jgi:hypothetical protein
MPEPSQEVAMKNKELISIIFSVFYLYSTTADNNLKACPCRYGPM